MSTHVLIFVSKHKKRLTIDNLRNNKLAICITNNQQAYSNLVNTCKTAPTCYLYYLYLRSTKYFMRYLDLDEDNDLTNY
jgi:hypothetical protein